MSLPECSELPVDVGLVLQHLESAGRLQLTLSTRGVTHECFGTGMQWLGEDGWFVRRNEVGVTRLDPAAVTRIIADRTMRMGERTLPRVEFRAGDGSRILAAYALDGEAPFASALAGLFGADAAPVEDSARPPAVDLLPDDPGHVLLERLAAAGKPVTIVMEQPAIAQEWHGAFSTLHAMRGFDNIILDDFHLHLRGGTVSAWEEQENGASRTYRAIGADGTPLGLAITAEA